jgi:catechol 2,3-dioxygenase-like lactoylglutathione lyase family enzyme
VRINHVGLCVTDLERSTRFYTEAFGFAVARELSVPDGPTSTLLQVPPPVGLTAVYLDLDGFTLELLHFDREGNDAWRPRTFTEPGLTHLSIGVADIPATCEKVEALGGEVLRATDVAGHAILVRDPDGQLLELLPTSAGA